MVLSLFFCSFSYAMLMYQLPLQILEDSGLTLLGFSLFLPMLMQVVFGTLFGYLADRYNRERLLVISYGCYLAGVCLAMGTAFNLNEYLRDAFLITAVLLFGAAIAGIDNLINVLTPSYFAGEDLGEINSIIRMLVSAAMILAPLTAGFLKSEFHDIGSLACSFLLAALSFAFAWAVLKRAPEPTAEQQTDENTNPNVSYKETIRTVLSNKVLRWVTIGFAVSYLGIGCVNALEVPFVTNELEVGSAGFAYMLSWAAVSMLCGNVLYNFLSKKISLETGFLIGTFGVALAWLLFSFAPNFMWAMVSVLIASAASSFLNVSGISLVQKHAVPEQMGTSIAIFSGVFHITGAVSLMLWSFVADHLLSLRYTLATASVVALVAFVPALIISKRRELSQEQDPQHCL